MTTVKFSVKNDKVKKLFLLFSSTGSKIVNAYACFKSYCLSANQTNHKLHLWSDTAKPFVVKISLLIGLETKSINNSCACFQLTKKKQTQKQAQAQ